MFLWENDNRPMSPSISFSSSLSGLSGVSITSSSFATLQAGKSYVFDIVIWGSSNGTAQDIELTVVADGQSPFITTNWFSSTAKTYRLGVSQGERSLFGRVVVNGIGTNSEYKLKVIIASGFGIDSWDQITFAGGFSGQLVGSVS